MLHYFEEENGSLVFRENGETVMVTPWGEDSLRVRAVFLGDIAEGSAALLEPENKIGRASYRERVFCWV